MLFLPVRQTKKPKQKKKTKTEKIMRILYKRYTRRTGLKANEYSPFNIKQIICNTENDIQYFKKLNENINTVNNLMRGVIRKRGLRKYYWTSEVIKPFIIPERVYKIDTTNKMWKEKLGESWSASYFKPKEKTILKQPTSIESSTFEYLYQE